MKKVTKLLVSIVIIVTMTQLSAVKAIANEQIIVETTGSSIVYTVGDNGRLYQSYFGKRLANRAEYANLPLGKEAYLTHGMEDYFEPALHVLHADGNPSTLLLYQSHETEECDGGKETVIYLVDPAYNVNVALHFVAFTDEDVFKEWVEIANNEGVAVTIEKYMSSLLHLYSPRYYLTQFNGNWAGEVQEHTQELYFGKKVLDSKLGSRENLYASPFFILSLGSPATENCGDALLGTLAWTGNFRFTFEVDNLGCLRVLSGINPYASQYILKNGEHFKTPEFIFTLSHNGIGAASRRFHDWARKYQIKDGAGNRMTLLNNWEATYFNFDEEKLKSLIADASDLGVDMFLLDDGWFGNKYSRHSDTQALGDWEVTANKLPNGLECIIEESERHGIKFGLWIEPEMVSPRSELYERHEDWIIKLPNRETYYFRNQLVLDLSNPEVQDYVYDVVDGLMTKYPGIAFFKWDCNSPITNIYSNYEGMNQSHLYVDYVRGLYNVLNRIKVKYPDLPMMLCSGGGGRTDYEALKYFVEMWPSDNTDPVERLFIQWGYSTVFPAKVQCAHVTSWNKDASIKFRVNVAMMGKLGFDINLHEISSQELAYCKQSVIDFNRLKPVVLDGDQYRLVSPYEGNHTSTMYVSKDKRHAVVFTFDIYPRYSEKLFNVVLDGLNKTDFYAVREINRSDCSVGESKTYSGEYLMTIGLPLFTGDKLSSRVYEVVAR